MVANNVIQLAITQQGKGYSCAEDVVAELGKRILAQSDINFSEVARQVGCTSQTIANLCKGRTRWPRANTLFGVITYLRLQIALIPLDE